LRQAYDYWQDQPGNYPLSPPHGFHATGRGPRSPLAEGRYPTAGWCRPRHPPVAGRGAGPNEITTMSFSWAPHRYQSHFDSPRRGSPLSEYSPNNHLVSTPRALTRRTHQEGIPSTRHPACRPQRESWLQPARSWAHPQASRHQPSLLPNSPFPYSQQAPQGVARIDDPHRSP